MRGCHRQGGRGRRFFATENLGAGEELSDSEFHKDWRAFRAQLVAQEKQKGPEDGLTVANPREEARGRWAHELAAPETGCLLVARLDDMGIFNKSVVLLLHHDDREGTLGVIINRPSSWKLSEASVVEPPWLKEIFPDQTLYNGGPIGRGNVNIIHGCAELPGAKQVVDGVFCGGGFPVDTLALAKAGTLEPKKVQVILGYAGWGPHQLAGELHDKSWWVLAASKEVMLGNDTAIEPYDTDYHSRYWEELVQLSGVK